KKLSELVSELPEYHMYKIKVSCPDEKKERAMSRMAKSLSSMKMDRTDGLKIHAEDGWILIRPSGTEAIIRVYAEARSRKRAEEMAKEKARLLRDVVKKVS
ncbi:MAG: phosphoglucosamine mutase, partial [Thermoplasmata archaeon]